MLESTTVASQELPALIARLRANGKRASTITAVATDRYCVTVAGTKAPEGGAIASEHRLQSAEALAGLCRRLERQGTWISSLRAEGVASYALTVANHGTRHLGKTVIENRACDSNSEKPSPNK